MRIEGWEARLATLLEGAVDRPFAWGQWDCCMMAASCIEALTGRDPATIWRGSYNDAAGGMAALQEIGGGLEGTVEAFARTHGWPEIPILTAQRGDLVIGPAGADGAMAAGVVSMDGRFAAFPASNGLRLLGVRSCARAWRV